MAELFWLSDEQGAVPEPLMPKTSPAHGAWMIRA